MNLLLHKKVLDLRFPSRIIPTTYLPVYEDIATAFRENGLQLNVTKTSDQINLGKKPLDTTKEVKVAFTGIAPDSPPEEVDILLFEDAKDKVLAQRQEILSHGFKPDDPIVLRSLKSAIHTATVGVNIQKNAIKAKEELPGKLREIKDKLDRDTAEILRRAAQRISELKGK